MSCFILFEHSIDYVITSKFICWWENPREQDLNNLLVADKYHRLTPLQVHTLFKQGQLETLDAIYELCEIEQGEQYYLPQSIRDKLESTEFQETHP